MSVNQNELLRDHITQNWATLDYTKQEDRRKSVDLFLAQNPNVKPLSARAAHQKQLEKIVKDKAAAGDPVDPEKFKMAKTIKPRYSPAISASITPQPAVIPGSPPPAAGGPQVAGAPQVAGPQVAAAGGPQVAGAVPMPPPQHDPETVGAVWDGIYTGLRITIPDAEELSPKDRENLGKVWAPLFNRYLAGHEKMDIVIALGATIGILGGKLIKGIQTKQAKTKDRKTPAQRSLERQGPPAPPAAPVQGPPAPNKPAPRDPLYEDDPN